MSVTMARSATNELPNPDAHVKASLGFQTLLNEGDRKYIVMVSFWDVLEKDLWNCRRYLGFWVNQMSFERSLRVPQEVPNTGGRLVWLDLRWYGWNQRAWQAVASRDPFTREPWVTHLSAEALRQGAGYKGIKPVKGDDGRESTPALVMVNGRWFIRETLETDRSTSYYDLLFARFRFPDGDHHQDAPGKTEEYETTERYYWAGGYGDNGHQYNAGWYTRKVKKTREVQGAAKTYAAHVDFPKDIQDWERAFGIDKLRAFARDTYIDLDYGAVVAGGRDDPDRGSIVALNNRLLVIYDGPLGKHMRSYDVFKTTGDHDYSEKLIFKKGAFRKGDGADAVFDAGEILSDLPNGGQAGFLINGKGERAEIAANKAADGRNADRHLSAGVRNYGDCMICHAGGGGFVLPRDQEKEDLGRGIKRKFKDRHQQQRYEGFFEQWEEDLAASRVKYQRMVAKTTIHPHKIPIAEEQPWNGSMIAEMTRKFREEYDAPVTPERAALVLGVPVAMYKYLASRGGVSEDYKTRNHRLNQQVQGKAIPSTTFESDVFRQAGFLLDAYRSDPEYRALFGKERAR